MNYDPKNPKWEDRDKLLVSAGHKCLALYGALIEAGYVDKEVLNEYNKLNSHVPAHPDMKKLPGVEFSTGSLGHGLPLACGMAIAAKMKKKPTKLYVIMGDGEQGEGSVWEAASFASAKGLDNICGILDRNGLQINGTNCQVCDTSPLERRYEAFGWGVMVVDGHDVKALYDAFVAPNPISGKPKMIICNTIKSKGMPFAEGNVKYHHWNPGKEEAEAAIKALKDYESRWA
jgi:transketolase